MKKLILLSCLIWAYEVSAQLSPVQDSKGESSIFIRDGFNLNFNFTSSDISLSTPQIYLGSDYYLGLQSKFGTVNGVSSLVKNGDFTPSVQPGLLLFKEWIGQKDRGAGYTKVLNEVFLAPSYSGETINLYNNTLGFDDLTDDTYVSNYSIGLGFNSRGGWYAKEKITDPSDPTKTLSQWHSTIFGASVTFGERTNIDKLTKQTIYDEITVYNQDSTRSRVLQSEEKQAYANNEFMAHNSFLNINVDYVFFPRQLKNTLGISAFYRFRSLKDHTRIHSPGLGFYLTQAAAGMPENISGGLVWQFNDLFNGRDKDNSAFERSVVSLIVGYTFK